MAGTAVHQTYHRCRPFSGTTPRNRPVPARLIASGEQDEHRLENLDELVGLASEFEPESDAEELALNPVELFLEHVSLISAADERDDDEPKITLMTLHNAKGLEYPVVYIPGVDEDLLPHFRARDTGDREDIEEERRLLYVGVTRAERLLFLDPADQRFSRRTMRLPESRVREQISTRPPDPQNCGPSGAAVGTEVRPGRRQPTRTEFARHAMTGRRSRPMRSDSGRAGCGAVQGGWRGPGIFGTAR